MIDANGWLSEAVRRYAPSEKHGYTGNPEPGKKDGLVVHSMEGSLRAALSRLDGPDRASWTFSNPKVGPLLQHYPLGFHSWASGSVKANVFFTSCEHEGLAGEPLTASQIDNLVLLIRAVAQHEGWPGFRRSTSETNLDATLWEHREMTRFGGAPTACPSGRIPWDVVLRRLGGDMTAEQVQQLNDATAAIKLVEQIVVELKTRLDAIAKAAAGT